MNILFLGLLFLGAADYHPYVNEVTPFIDMAVPGNLISVNHRIVLPAGKYWDRERLSWTSPTFPRGPCTRLTQVFNVHNPNDYNIAFDKNVRWEVESVKGDWITLNKNGIKLVIRAKDYENNMTLLEAAEYFTVYIKALEVK